MRERTTLCHGRLRRLSGLPRWQVCVDLPGATICQESRYVCPVGKKACRGTCIPETECCGDCLQRQTCCNKVGLCKDLLNDPAFCGQCANGQFPVGSTERTESAD